ncbi:MAG: type II toxin-antitoxin system RelE/ParE family toxin [Betaproteobacteria bacterium]|nr:type II toxin-antitoxin system RelE/ParE family toxin [Betaproteobacteria bacterium]
MRVDLRPRAEKRITSLEKSNPRAAKIIAAKIKFLASNPKPSGIVKMKGVSGECWRIVAGDFRIIYSIKNDFLMVEFIEKRNDDEAYRKFNRLK